MIDFQFYSPDSPSNIKAAVWAKRNTDLFPQAHWSLVLSHDSSNSLWKLQLSDDFGGPSIRIAPEVTEHIFYKATRPYEVAGILIGSQSNDHWDGTELQTM